MTESVVIINNNKSIIVERYLSLSQSGVIERNGITIIDNIQFEEMDGWCYLTIMDGGSCAEEFLLEMAKGGKLIYFYSDDSQLDCEFVVINSNKIIRKRYIYADTPELDEDEGVLLCEDRELNDWSDIDYLIDQAKDNPDRIFE